MPDRGSQDGLGDGRELEDHSERGHDAGGNGHDGHHLGVVDDEGEGVVVEGRDYHQNGYMEGLHRREQAFYV